MVLRSCSVVGVIAGGFKLEEEIAAFDRLCAMAERVEIRIPLGKVYAFDSVADVVQMLDSNSLPGKLVVRVAA